MAISPQTTLDMLEKPVTVPDPNCVFFSLIYAWEEKERARSRLITAEQNLVQRLRDVYHAGHKEDNVYLNEENVIFCNGKIYLVRLDVDDWPDRCTINRLPGTAVHDDGSGASDELSH